MSSHPTHVRAPVPRWDGDCQRGVLFLIVIALLLSAKSNKLRNLAAMTSESASPGGNRRTWQTKRGLQSNTWSGGDGPVDGHFPLLHCQVKVASVTLSFKLSENVGVTHPPPPPTSTPHPDPALRSIGSPGNRPDYFCLAFPVPGSRGDVRRTTHSTDTAGFTTRTSPLLLAQAHTCTSHHHQSGHPRKGLGMKKPQMFRSVTYQKPHQKLS